MPPPSGLHLGELLRSRGVARRCGELIVNFSSVGSTNEVALQFARRGAPGGSLFLADEQTAGRGRLGRHFFSPPGLGLYSSVLFRPSPGASLRASLVPLAASIAVAEALRAESLVPVAIRWPNDLYANDRKLGGILCEGSFAGDRMDFVVIGIGVNLNHAASDFERSEAGPFAGSLHEITGERYDRDQVACAIVERMEEWWSDLELGNETRVVSRWQDLAEGHVGTRVLVQKEGGAYEAVTEGISKDGGLIVRLPSGRSETLLSGDVIRLQSSKEGAGASPPEEDYYRAVEKHFVALRGSPLFITPQEWQLVHRWRESEIPLRVVNEALDRAVERGQRKPRNRPLKLSYCRPTVEAHFRRFREALVGEVGRDRATERQADREKLAEYLRKLRDALVERRAHPEDTVPELLAVLDRSAARLSALAEGLQGPEGLAGIETELDALDTELVETAERALAGETRERLRREAEQSIQDYRSRMPDAVFRSALESAFVKKVRASSRLPALSLFYF